MNNERMALIVGSGAGCRCMMCMLHSLRRAVSSPDLDDDRSRGKNA